MDADLEELLPTFIQLVENHESGEEAGETPEAKNFRCVDCVGCTNCRFCTSCERCDECTYCDASIDCEKCTQSRELVGCSATSHSSHSAYCEKSSYLTLCYSCKDCVHCFGCVGMRGAEFCVLNKKYPRREYFEAVAKLQSSLDAKALEGWVPPWLIVEPDEEDDAALPESPVEQVEPAEAPGSWPPTDHRSARKLDQEVRDDLWADLDEVPMTPDPGAISSVADWGALLPPRWEPEGDAVELTRLDDLDQDLRLDPPNLVERSGAPVSAVRDATGIGSRETVQQLESRLEELGGGPPAPFAHDVAQRIEAPPVDAPPDVETRDTQEIPRIEVDAVAQIEPVEPPPEPAEAFLALDEKAPERAPPAKPSKGSRFQTDADRSGRFDKRLSSVERARGEASSSVERAQGGTESRALAGEAKGPSPRGERTEGGTESRALAGEAKGPSPRGERTEGGTESRALAGEAKGPSPRGERTEGGTESSSPPDRTKSGTREESSTRSKKSSSLRAVRRPRRR